MLDGIRVRDRRVVEHLHLEITLDRRVICGELVDAIRKIVASGVGPSEVDDEIVDSYLYQPEIPGMDLMIRTSGERRTSGFMMWRADYAEFVILGMREVRTARAGIACKFATQ